MSVIQNIRLLRNEAQLRKEALDVNALANDLGLHVRRWGLAHALSDNDQSLQIMLWPKRAIYVNFAKYTKPLIKTLMSKGYEFVECRRKLSILKLKCNG